MNEQFVLHFIDLKSKKTIQLDSLNNTTNFIELSKLDEKTTQLTLNNKKADISFIPSFLLSCKIPNQYKKPFILLGKGITLKELTQLYSTFHSVNFPLISVISKYDFKSRSFHYYDIRIELFTEELLKNGPPPREFDISRKDYLAKYNPEIITIKSKQGFTKLNSIKPNSHYLVSINLDLPIEDFLNLNQDFFNTSINLLNKYFPISLFSSKYFLRLSTP